MGQRVRLETQRAVAVELEDVLPREECGLFAVPREGRPAVRDRRSDEDGCPKAALGEDRKRVIGDVEVAVVEAESHRPGERRARVEEVDRGEDVDDAVRLGGEVVHLLRESFRRHGQLVAVVGDPVVEEDPEPAVSRRPRVRISHAAERARVPPALAR